MLELPPHAKPGLAPRQIVIAFPSLSRCQIPGSDRPCEAKPEGRRIVYNQFISFFHLSAIELPLTRLNSSVERYPSRRGTLCGQSVSAAMGYSHRFANIVARQAPGSSTQDSANSPSLSQLYSTLLPVFVVASIFTIGFLVLRRILRRNYAPRAFLGSLRPQ